MGKRNVLPQQLLRMLFTQHTCICAVAVAAAAAEKYLIDDTMYLRTCRPKQQQLADLHHSVLAITVGLMSQIFLALWMVLVALRTAEISY